MTTIFVAAVCAVPLVLTAQDMPADYQDVLKTLGRTGDFKANVLKINIPRNDLKVTIDGTATPTPFGFGGWLAMSKGTGGHEVMMGDLVLLEEEANPVLSALLDNGLEVTALHNHFFFENPRVFYMHVHGHGKASDLAKMVKPAVDLIGHAPAASSKASISAGTIDTANIAAIAGHEGEQNGPVYKITVGRDDLKMTEMGVAISARMGLNTWAAFFGSDSSAEIAGDVAMLDRELTPVLKALRKNGLNIVAIHQHMTNTHPQSTSCTTGEPVPLKSLRLASRRRWINWARSEAATRGGQHERTLANSYRNSCGVLYRFAHHLGPRARTNDGPVRLRARSCEECYRGG